MAGDSFPFLITANDTVGDLKRRITNEHAVECEPAYQRLFMMPEEEKSNAASAASSSHTPLPVLNDDSKTLLSYGVMAGTTLHVICNIRYLTPVNEFASRSVGYRMAISHDNKEVYIPYRDTIKILNTLDGSVDVIDFTNDANPIAYIMSICLSPESPESPDDEYFFILGKDARIPNIIGRSLIQKRRRSDKSLILTIPAEDNPRVPVWYNICMNDTSLFAADAANNIINVFDIVSGNPVSTIGNHSQLISPIDVTITRNNELFVLEGQGSGRVRVFRATSGEPLPNFILPSYVRMLDVSPDDNFMYVNGPYTSGRIEVRNALDGALLEAITLDENSEDKIIKDICVSPDGDFVFVATNVKIIQYKTPGRKMGGRRYKKHGMRRKHRKSRVRRRNKRETKRKQRK
jgi:DNA-binding beta-propeller fold protein YncE